MTTSFSPTLLLQTDATLINIIQTAHNDAQQAKLILLQRYNNLLLKTITPYLQYCHDFKELEATATYGFLLAIERYNPLKGKSLGSYARPYMVGFLSDLVSLLQKPIKEEKSIDDEDNKKLLKTVNDLIDETNLDEEADRMLLISDIAALRHKLSPRENKLIDIVFFQGKTFKEAATEMNISKPRASQIWTGIREKGRIQLKHYQIN